MAVSTSAYRAYGVESTAEKQVRRTGQQGKSRSCDIKFNTTATRRNRHLRSQPLDTAPDNSTAVSYDTGYSMRRDRSPTRGNCVLVPIYSRYYPRASVCTRSRQSKKKRSNCQDRDLTFSPTHTGSFFLNTQIQPRFHTCCAK